jgi:hypothetical protein
LFHSVVSNSFQQYGLLAENKVITGTADARKETVGLRIKLLPKNI